jgi:hypothetical protein
MTELTRRALLVVDVGDLGHCVSTGSTTGLADVTTAG